MFKKAQMKRGRKPWRKVREEHFWQRHSKDRGLQPELGLACSRNNMAKHKQLEMEE